MMVSHIIRAVLRLRTHVITGSYSRKKGEDEDFEEVLRSMKQLRAELEHIRVCMKAYLKCVAKLAKAAQSE